MISSTRYNLGGALYIRRRNLVFGTQCFVHYLVGLAGSLTFVAASHLTAWECTWDDGGYDRYFYLDIWAAIFSGIEKRMMGQKVPQY